MSVLQTNAFNHLATQPYFNNSEIVDSANGNRSPKAFPLAQRARKGKGTRIVPLKDG
jgi:hypothetical protein